MTVRLLQIVFRENRAVLILLSTFLLLTVLLWLYLLLGQQRQRDQLYQQWTEKRQFLQESGNSSGLASYRRSSDGLKQLLASVPARSEFPRILGQVTDVVAMQKATLVSLSYKQLPSSVEGLLCYSLAVSVKGDYAALKQVLSDLQHLQQLSSVDAIGSAHVDQQSDQVVLDATLVFYLRPDSRP